MSVLGSPFPPLPDVFSGDGFHSVSTRTLISKEYHASDRSKKNVMKPSGILTSDINDQLSMGA